MKRSLPVVLAIAAYVLAVIIWLAVDRRVPRVAFDDFSAENTSGKGLSLARRYLATGRRVTLLERPIDGRFLPKNGVVFRVGSIRSFFDFVRDLEKEQDSKPEDDDKTKKPPEKKAQPLVKPQAKPKLKPTLKPKRERATPLLDDEEEEWVRGGGRLVLATSRGYGGLAVRGAPPARGTKAFPRWRGIHTIHQPEPRTPVGNPGLPTAPPP